MCYFSNIRHNFETSEYLCDVLNNSEGTYQDALRYSVVFNVSIGPTGLQLVESAAADTCSCAMNINVEEANTSDHMFED